MSDRKARIFEMERRSDRGSNEPECSGRALERVREIIDSEDLSQQAVAKEAGISAATLNQWLSGRYTGDVEAVTGKMEKWLASREPSLGPAKSVFEIPRWIEIPTARRLLKALDYIRILFDIAIIYGGAGLGKTKTLERFAEMFPNVWIVTMSPATAGVCAALEEIALTLGLRGIPGRAARLQREIVRRLKGTRGVLIIDEAQHLMTSSLEAIRSIHDASETGLVLCGNELIFSRLTGGARLATFAQLYSRVGVRVALRKTSLGDVKAICAALGIEGAKETRFLYEISQKPGGLRSIMKTMQLAYVMASGEGATASMRHLEMAWNDLTGD